LESRRNERLQDLFAAIAGGDFTDFSGYSCRAEVYRATGNISAAAADEERARNVPTDRPDRPEFMLLVAIRLMLNPITGP
jgi:hypothetical protein